MTFEEWRSYNGIVYLSQREIEVAKEAWLASRKEALEEAAKSVPSNNWCDPMLTGPNSALGKYPWGCPDIERLLGMVSAQIRALTREAEDR